MPLWSEPASGYQLAVTLGVPEALVILAIVLLLFGGKKLPQVGEALGKAIRNFRKGAEEAAKELPEGEEPAAGAQKKTEQSDERVP